MTEKDYEIMKELIYAREIRDKFIGNYRDYSWARDILDIVSAKLMDLEDSFIADIKKR